jgi:NAD(P)-dependent dehydrogenase (short-subunit alcohol dehydrogenase family)
MSPAAFIVGAGGHLGLAIANKLKHEGYKVAVGSRKPLQKEGLIPITVDVSNTDSITKAFAEVKEKLGAAPNVVIFNGSSVRPRPPSKGLIFNRSHSRPQSLLSLCPKFQATPLRSHSPP